MKPSDWLIGIVGHYPPAATFPDGMELAKEDARRFVSLWMAEGIPFAFLDCPGTFQAARERIASEIGVSFRDISMTGSARLGYSLNPRQFGQVFVPEQSDIDLFLVSKRWFDDLSLQGRRFIDDYRSGRVRPRNENEKGYWEKNVDLIHKGVENGFVDAKKIPTFNSYPAVQKMGNAAYLFVSSVNKWSGRNLVRKCSIRTYESWSSAVNQMGYNLRSALKHRLSA